jgi:hypothetical protein
MVVFVPEQMALFEPAFAIGNGLTVMVTLLLFVHPVAVMVSVKVYNMVIVGDMAGFAWFDINPAGPETQL